VTAERRSCRRFQPPGAAVDWQSTAGRNQGGTDCPIGDLARGGVRFLTPDPPREGALVKMTVNIPGESASLVLEGRVVWTHLSGGQFHQVAVAFEPYSPAPGDNDPATLERLIALEARFPDAPR
jgi:hypothetical protein